MSNFDKIEYYKKMMAFYTEQYEWYTEQIARCNKLIKQETYDFGLSLEGEATRRREIRLIMNEKMQSKN